MKKICLLLTFVFVMLLGVSALADMDVKELTVQFVPTNTETADATTAEFSAYMTELMGIPVKMTVATSYNAIVEAFATQNVRALRLSQKSMRRELDLLKKYRRQEMLGLRRSPMDLAIERNTWFHLGINSSEQFIYCLRRMLDPVKEHVDNSFNPLPKLYIDEFEPIRQRINDLMKQTDSMISTRRFDNYRNILEEADVCKDELSVVRKRHIDRIQQAHDNQMLQVSLVYLNILQESQQLLSNMRHQLRAAKKFIEN